MKTVFTHAPLSHKIMAWTIVGILAFLTINAVGGRIAHAFSSPEAQLEKLKTDACDRIRAKESECFHEGSCDLTESSEWFQNTFNASMIDECFAINAELLRFGGE